MKIIIPGTPIAKNRPRFARRGKFTTTYSDQQTEEGKFFLLARGQIKCCHSGPLKMICEFFFSRPKSHFGTGRNAGKLKKSAPKHNIKKPDVDNLLKFVCDCLNESAYNDDAQIVSKTGHKKYVTEGNIPRTVITIVPIS